MRSVVLAFALVAAAASCAADPSTSQGSGGTPGKGGTTSTGGKSGSGGATSKGGTTSAGGSSQPPASVDCQDTSTFSTTISNQYGGTPISVDGNSNKTYYMIANWWGTPYNSQSESLYGLGFTMSNPNNVVTSVKDNPMGFPSIFIGSYSGKTTKGSNLPKQVSALTSVPTVFSTNADQKGTANYNATYDVWMTKTDAVVTGSSPGPGGAYLMVWLFKPTDRQPRGTIQSSGHSVDGIPGSWTIWYDEGNPNANPPSYPCVSYVSNTVLSSLEFDLNNFIQDAVKSENGVTSSQYLSIVFAGFEVWGGGDGLQIKRFCANVE